MTPTPEWVTVDEVIALNKRTVAATNEPYLLVSLDGLASAVGRQVAHYDFGPPEDHDDLVLIGAKLCIGISQAQSFQQGNKRTGLAAMQMLFNLNGFTFSDHAHDRISKLIHQTAHADHSVRMGDEEFAERIDEFVIEHDEDFVRGGIVSDYNMAKITIAMGQATSFEIGEGVAMLTAGSIGSPLFENMKIAPPGLLTPEQYRKLGGLDISKHTFEPKDPDDAE